MERAILGSTIKITCRNKTVVGVVLKFLFIVIVISGQQQCKQWRNEDFNIYLLYQSKQ